MSHFAVMVVAEDEEDMARLLAPFDENTEKEPREEKCYCVKHIERNTIELGVAQIMGSTDDLRDWMKILTKKNKLTEMETQKQWEFFVDQYKEFKEEEAERLKNENPEFGTIADIECEDCGGTGVSTTTYNPESKWDWYAVGGRWSGYLLNDEGVRCDFALKSEIDFKTMGSLTQKERTEAEKYYKQCKTGKAKPEMFGLFDPNEILEFFKTQEEYLEFLSMQKVVPYAYLDAEKGWIAKGEMGWFGMSSDTAEDRVNWVKNFFKVIEEIDEDMMVFIVDCHI